LFASTTKKINLFLLVEHFYIEKSSLY